MKIKVEKYLNVGYYAQCQQCDWDAAISTKETPLEQDVRNAITRHIRQTEHRVRLESTSSRVYGINY